MNVLIAKPVNEAVVLDVGEYGAYQTYYGDRYLVIGNGNNTVGELVSRIREGNNPPVFEITNGEYNKITLGYSLYDNKNKKWRISPEEVKKENLLVRENFYNVFA